MNCILDVLLDLAIDTFAHLDDFQLSTHLIILNALAAVWSRVVDLICLFQQLEDLLPDLT